MMRAAWTARRSSWYSPTRLRTAPETRTTSRYTIQRRDSSTTSVRAEGLPQGGHREGHQEPLGREDQGREVPRQMGNQEHREPLGREDQGREVPRQMGDQEHRGDTHRCEGVEEYLVR